MGLKPTIPAGERPQTYALDRAATGTGYVVRIRTLIIVGKVRGVTGVIEEVLGCNLAEVKSLLYYVAF
jgi:hypothetical protein